MVDNHRYMRAVDGWTPMIRHYAIRTYRIGSSKFGRLDIVTGNSYEKLSGEIARSIECEATDSGERFTPRYCSGGVQTIATVQGGV